MIWKVYHLSLDEDNEELIQILISSIGSGNGFSDFIYVFSRHNYSFKEWRIENPNSDPEDYYSSFEYLDDFNLYTFRTKSKFFVTQLRIYCPRDSYEWYCREIDEKNLN